MPNCNAFKNHMCVSNVGSWTPCCRFESFEYFDISKVSFQEYKSSEFYQNIQKEMETGWTKGCEKCLREEQSNLQSLRLSYNDFLSGNENIEYIELNISNECNLMCRMCSPVNSSSWNKIAVKHKLQGHLKPFENKTFDVNKIFKNIDLTKINRIKYLGGEPFITPQIKDLFELLLDNNIIQNIEFEFTTNSTLFPNKWIKYLDKAKKVNIELSIDGIGLVQDYIRQGKTWDKVKPVLDQWIEYNKQDNIDLNFFTTVQAYNIHDIKNIKLLADSAGVKHYTNVLAFPDFLSINALPNDYLDKVKDSYNEKFYSFIDNKKDLFNDFKDFTIKLDKIFGISLEEVNPLLYEYFK